MSTVPSAPPAAPARRFDVFDAGSPQWEECERALANAGIRLPLAHRAGWARVRRGVSSQLVALRGTDGDWVAAFGVYAAASRALPGFRLLRVERFGEAVPRAAWAAAAEALVALARRQPRVLRLSVELFSRDDNTRRAIRAVAKLPVQVRLIDDRALASRMEALSCETFARTGGEYQALWDWAGVIELSDSMPDASRLVGLFRTDKEGPEALLGFAWGCWNGQSVSYLAGASTRPTDQQRVGIVHPLFWDLIGWAKGTGGTWFDLGGVTAGTVGSGDPVGGISDFKRLFSKDAIDVADDWVFTPRRLPAGVAAILSTGAAWLSRVVRR